jgi:hypothetical protein
MMMPVPMPMRILMSGLVEIPNPDLWFSLGWYLLFVLIPVGFVAWLAYYLLSLPLRRQERARLFLDLLESALHQGRPVEQTLVDMANRRPDLGSPLSPAGCLPGGGVEVGGRAPKGVSVSTATNDGDVEGGSRIG